MPKLGNEWVKILRGWRSASDFLGSLGLFGLLGWLADRAWPNIRPWGLLIGLLAGLAIGTWQISKTTKEN